MVSTDSEVQDILIQARSKTLSLGLSAVTTEIVLDAILSTSNKGHEVIKSNFTDLPKLRASLKERFQEIKLDVPSTAAIPRISPQLRTALNFAQMISQASINSENLVYALYQDSDSVAGQFLRKCGYTPVGNLRQKINADADVGVKTPILDSFSTDLTKLALSGKLDPVIGRDTEIMRVAEILARRKKNNPALIGEPGTGKTAIVEGLALLIVGGKAPANLLDKRVLSLNISSIVAGTQFRGQFEQRMQGIIQELQKSENVILFIDEMHTLMGTGGTEGTGDTAQILKPALSRGSIRCIGATTLSEYRKHIEKDGALERRFQKLMVEPPSMEMTLEILTRVKSYYEAFHNVTYTTDALEAIVSSADRYIQDRFFPDKAFDVLDEAGALGNLQNQRSITREEILSVVSRMAGVPLSTMSKSEREKLKSIESDLSHFVIGQDDAIKMVSQAVKRKRTGIKTDKRPSTFLFLGPTGTGKTELARRLAEYLFGSQEALIRLDMSEYYDRFTISSLIGAPPGYVGYDEGGSKLTEKVKNKPYSVVLFDEIEKAHPDIFNVLLQIFDDGVLTDAQGRKVSFKNCIVILTSNIGTSTIHKRSVGFSEYTDEVEIKKNLTESLKGFFKPEFLNRLDGVIPFQPLSKENIGQILRLMLSDFNSSFKVHLSTEAEEFLVNKGYSLEYGARPLRRLIEQEIETKISDILLDSPDEKEFKVLIEENEIKVLKEGV